MISRMDIKRARILIDSLHKLGVPKSALKQAKEWADKEEKKLDKES